MAFVLWVLATVIIYIFASFNQSGPLFLIPMLAFTALYCVGWVYLILHARVTPKWLWVYFTAWASLTPIYIFSLVPPFIFPVPGILQALALAFALPFYPLVVFEQPIIAWVIWVSMSCLCLFFLIKPYFIKWKAKTL